VSTSLIGAEGLYSETYDNLYLRQGINFNQNETFRKNEIDSYLKKKMTFDKNKVFEPDTLPTGNNLSNIFVVEFNKKMTVKLTNLCLNFIIMISRITQKIIYRCLVGSITV
jgi:hypothetical protein